MKRCEYFCILCWMICKCQDVRDVGKVQELRTAEVPRPAGGGARSDHLVTACHASQPIRGQGWGRLTNQRAGTQSQNILIKDTHRKPRTHVPTGVGSKSNYRQNRLESWKMLFLMHVISVVRETANIIKRSSLRLDNQSVWTQARQYESFFPTNYC